MRDTCKICGDTIEQCNERANRRIDLKELAERCEQAAGPDRELDEAIVLTALGWKRADYKRGGRTIRAWDNGEYRQERAPDFYTASLDAAMTLVPDGISVRLFVHPDESHCDIYQSHQAKEMGEAEQAATPALALCAAALRAIAAHQAKDQGR